MNAAVRLGLVLGLYLVAASPSLAQITQDAYVANQHDGTVSVVDTATQVVSTITLGSTGNGLLGVAVTPDGLHAYVTNQSDNTVSVIDTATQAVVSTIPVGSNPYGVAVTSNGLHAYVTNNSDNTVSVIDTATHTVISTIHVGSDPFGVTVVSSTEEKVAFLDAGREKFRESLSDYALWSPLLDFRCSHF